MERKTAKKLMAMIFVAMLVTLVSTGTVSAAVTVERLTQLTTDPAHDHNPQWSPDSKEILFQRTSNPQKMIELKLFDLSETVLTTHQYPGIFRKHSYSKDGTKIVYVRDYGTGWVDVSVMNSDGSSDYCITCSDWGLSDMPRWGPTTGKIFYIWTRDGYNTAPGKIISVNPDGSEKTTLVENEHFNPYFALSPDGSKILYGAETYRNSHIYIYKLKDLNTGTITDLDRGQITQQTQSWNSQIFSPDGSKIVYFSNENENWDIYTINIDGTGKTRLTTDLANDLHAYFSPDGNKIIFVSDRTGNNDIWVMDVDGGNKVQLTTSTSDDIQPVWSPDGSTILFKSDRSGNSDIWMMELGETLIPATIDIDPDTLNVKSNGEWITAYIELPEGYDVNDIDVSTIYLVDTILVDTSAPATVGDYDSDGISDLMVKFDRTAVVAYLGTEDVTEDETGTDYYAELTITGELTDETPYDKSYRQRKRQIDLKS